MMIARLVPGLAIVGGLWLLGDALKRFGSGVDETGDGALKIAVAGGLLYLAIKGN